MEYVVEGNNLIINDGISELDANSFSQLDVKNIIKVILPEGIKKIGSNTFSQFENLQDVNLTNSLIEIGSKAFMNCENLKQIKFGKKLENVREDAFKNSAIEIADFSKCRGKVNINSGSFENCRNLNQVINNGNIYFINFASFKGCEKLTDFNFKGVSCVADEAFMNSGLNSAENFFNTRLFGNKIFSGCKFVTLDFGTKTAERLSTTLNLLSDNNHLKTLRLNKQYNENICMNCENLQNVVLSNQVDLISAQSFRNCINLQNINLERVNQILYNAFSNCLNLKSIDLSSAKYIEACAFKNSHMESLKIQRKNFLNTQENKCLDDKSFENVVFESMVFDKKHIVFANKSINGAIFIYNFFKSINGFTINSLIKNPNNCYNLQKIDERLNMAKISLPYEFILEKFQLNENDINEDCVNKISKFCDEHDFTLFNKILINKNKNINKLSYNQLFNLGLMFGAFEKDKIVSQRACEFINMNLDKPEFEKLVKVFFKEKKVGDNILYNKEFVEMLYKKDQCKLLFDESFNDSKLFYKIYRDFNIVQSFHTSNRGNQRQLKATVSKFIDYFKDNCFIGITEETKPLAAEISKFTSTQKDFDIARSIFLKRQSSCANNQILDKEIVDNPFSKIDRIRGKIFEQSKWVQKLIEGVENNDYSFEFLSKDSVLNYTLGKYCDCCASIMGAGSALAVASVLDKNVQNLVIRDEVGGIVAKSIFYLDDKRHTLMFNSVEVKGGKDNFSNISNLELYRLKIFDKILEGVDSFIDEYNIENPQTPIVQANMGLDANDLGKLFENTFYTVDDDYSNTFIENEVYMKYNMGDIYVGNTSSNEAIMYCKED